MTDQMARIEAWQAFLRDARQLQPQERALAFLQRSAEKGGIGYHIGDLRRYMGMPRKDTEKVLHALEKQGRVRLVIHEIHMEDGSVGKKKLWRVTG